MYLEAVTVSVGYGDLLAAVASHNAPHLDRWVVVTEPGDAETREVCRRFALDVVLSEEGRRPGEPFAKGRLVNRGLRQLSAEGWRLHLDADVVLPPSFRRQLTIADLDPECIYGCDRVMVRSYEAWKRLEVSRWMETRQTDHYGVNWPPGFEPGTRWAAPHAGWAPIGFFQLWSSEADEWRGSRVRQYPERHGNACRTDVQFALKWDRRRRALLPEVIVAHLESEAGGLGINWRGRVTRRFGPPLAAPGGAGPS